jgi:hypothetical protein
LQERIIESLYWKRAEKNTANTIEKYLPVLFRNILFVTVLTFSEKNSIVCRASTFVL